MNLRLTPEQFERVCQANPDAVLELAADGTLIAMTPTAGETGARSLRLGQRLLSWIDRRWCRATRAGVIAVPACPAAEGSRGALQSQLQSRRTAAAALPSAQDALM